MRKLKTTPQGATLRRQLLFSTRAAGVRWREQWYGRLAEDSIRFNWSLAEARAAVKKDAEAARQSGKVTNLTNLIHEGGRASDPTVRGEYTRLVTLRDKVCREHRTFVLAKMKRPSHVLVNLMQLQRNASKRHHAANVDQYLAYLGHRVPRKQRGKPRKQQAPSQATISSNPPASPRSPTLLSDYLDKAMQEVSRLSLESGIPMERLIGAAVDAWFAEHL